ncbi:hypothetical protein [Lamposivirus ageladense]|uniref:Uncharacterized protein n=1 Tax=Circoviridae sp. TaxID=1954248 RepID=A0ABY4CGR1_9VIRU|nr:hypothetical protein [Circoviridae sp.]
MIFYVGIKFRLHGSKKIFDVARMGARLVCWPSITQHTLGVGVIKNGSTLLFHIKQSYRGRNSSDQCLRSEIYRVWS